MAEITFNINHLIRFKPTQFGKDHYRKKSEAIYSGLNLDTSDISLDLKIDKDGFASLQMHEFMYYFGDAAYVGGKSFIEKCEIFLNTEQI
ncbi:hypothetical protein [Acinetobacter baumannii]|uniref:hypothetical protein n=1 Tax=Acinetobacter baumannii TaxID=470 RepID=UPI0038923D07